jgi:SAM-dependent methyltransferase
MALPAPAGLEWRRRFAAEYRVVRSAEGWGSRDAAYYRALPFRDLTGRHTRIWRIRARSFETFLHDVLQPIERNTPRPLTIADLGAGNGWLAYRMAKRGHAVAALDVLDDPADGLRARRHYETAFGAVQAEFDHLPLRGAAFDLAVFNGALHYSTNCATTLRETLRVLHTGGTLVVLDTPMYVEAEHGRRMVEERERHFLADFGFRHAVPAEHFLTSARLRELGEALDLQWRVLTPAGTWRGKVGQWVTAKRRGREVASFPVLVGTRA